MPSASAKLEKQTSVEALEPVKQIVTMVEKKVRNLEKRKAKLDAYRHDSQSGKELNDDQKKAVEKYDQVVEVLEFAKELQKSFCGIIQETSKAQKKVAKREHLERHQHELQRIKEIISIQDILNSMGREDVRNDFLNETNGAIKLTDKELNSLDELYKLICPERDPESQDSSEFDRQLMSAAEHMQALLDLKSKEVIGTTYKELREIITRIHSCNYFNKAAVAVAASCSPDLVSNESGVGDDSNENTGESYNEGEDTQTTSYQADVKTSVANSNIQSQIDNSSFYQSEATTSYQDQNRPLQDVLPAQGNLDFLQESQIDLEGSPGLDKQATVPHSVASPGVGFPNSFVPPSTSVPQVMVSPRFQQRPKEDANNLISHHSQAQVLSSMAGAPGPQQQQQTQQQQQPQQQSGGLNLPSQSKTGGNPADFDPKQPIPTQTFTNQNFSGIHPLMAAAAAGVAVPQSYVPVTLAHGMPPQHMLPTSMVSQQQAQPRGTSVSSSGVLDPSSVLSSSVHNQTARLPVSTATKINLSAHDSKDHFNRDFLISQVSRENPHLGHQTTNAQFERVSAHEGYQPTSNSQTFIPRENFGTDSSSYSNNLKRGMPPRNLARGAAAAGRGASNISRGRPVYRT